MPKKGQATNKKTWEMPKGKVDTILRVKYQVPQADIDYLDDEFRLKLLKDLQNTPMLNEKT